MTDQDTGSPEPIKMSPLWEFLKEQEEDIQIGDGSREQLIEHLEETIKVVWEQASEDARSNNKKTVNPEDVRVAFQNLFEPHQLMEEASQMMGKYQREFDKEAKSDSPVLNRGDNE